MATGSRSKGKRSRTEGTGEEREGAGHPAPHHAAIHAAPLHASPVGHAPRRRSKKDPEARKLPRRLAAARISAAAERLAPEWADAAALLADLAAKVASQRRRGAGGAAVEGAILRCLDEAATEAPGAGRWALDEGAAWAAAWLARRTGRILERIHDEAREADDACRNGDTRPAALVVTLAGLFPDPPFRNAAARGTAALEGDIGRWTTLSGAPSTGISSAFVPRVVGWALAREAGLASGHGVPWDDATDERFHAAATAALRLLGDRGRIPGRGAPDPTGTAPLLEALLRPRAAQPRKRAVARTVAAVASGDAPAPGRTLPRDSLDGTLAVLRTGWERGAVRVLLDFGAAVHRLEVAGGSRLVFDGEWTFFAEADGRSLDPIGPWSVSCFESDDDATFLEIVAALPDGMQAERQVVLLPADRIVLLCDSVTDAGACLPAGKRPGRIAYRGRLSLAGGEAFPEEETRECRLAVGRRHWRVLPLGLPEWRSAAAPGSFDRSGATLELCQSSEGGRLTAPLWIDADPRRADRPLTWRQLTVADQRLILRRHEAVGFRVQAGLDQWLLYRALDTPRNRTLLGCNVACEFLLGRVRPGGEVKRTLEIE